MNSYRLILSLIAENLIYFAPGLDGSVQSCAGGERFNSGKEKKTRKFKSAINLSKAEIRVIG